MDTTSEVVQVTAFLLSEAIRFDRAASDIRTDWDGDLAGAARCATRASLCRTLASQI
jgi:hypothetical protein